MKIKASFAETNNSIGAKLTSANETLSADFGEVQVVPGADGFSPTVDIEPIDGGHRLSITDKDGTQTADVLDGRDGRDGRDGADGYTPVKGVDYFDGQPGAKGDPGDPGADGISPTVAVQDITGGHRVTITDKDGAKTFDVMNGKDGEGGGSGGDSPAIIDVVALPETDIDEDVFYRLLNGTFYRNGTMENTWTCYLAETLPTMGVPVTTDMVHVALYYAIDTQAVSGYIPDALAGAVGVPAGWYPVEALAQAFSLPWGGIISDESEDPIDDAIRLVLKYNVYYYKQKWVNLSDKVGWRSGVYAAEVFNSLRNTASGSSSHAEGYDTTASGNSSHAEGYDTTASGSNSHAEGANTTASGSSSHAEGYDTTASGSGSHAEGENTTASWENSHAEGWHTTASAESSHAEGAFTISSGRAQHVQGRFNVEDTSEPDFRRYRKYAHIVGNGTDIENRSNAHTLDWDGNAWYAGTVECTGVILTSPSGTRYRLTVADDGTLTTAAV